MHNSTQKLCNSVIIRYGEIGIKGKNRTLFEKQLLNNVREMLLYEKIKFKRVYRAYNRVIVEFYQEPNKEEDESNKEISKSLLCLRRIFGITSFSPALKTNLNLEEIKRNALLFYNVCNKNLKKEKIKRDNLTFRITTQRINKKFPINSQKINEETGAFVVENASAKVDLEKPNINIGVEILDRAYVFLERIKGSGGLPISSKEFFAIELKNKKSLIATLFMMKRGLNPIFILNNKDYERQKILLKLIEPFLAGKFNIEMIESNSDYRNKIIEIINSNNAVFVSEIEKVNKKSVKELQKLKNSYGIVLTPLLLMEDERINYYKKLLMKN
jgi:thiamine biosynthesis protein ThiI